MRYVIGIDLGTSAVKALLVDRNGQVAGEASRSYPLIQERSGWSEQRPEDWVEATVEALYTLMQSSGAAPDAVEGISFSGQMHGLVLLDAAGRPIRNAILWNDTRTTAQCRHIEAALGDKLHAIARNPALEGMTMPKLLWVQQHEPELLAQADTLLLPKDYVRYRLTGELHMDYSDAAGTLMLDIAARQWSRELLDAVGLSDSEKLLPPLVESHEEVGALLPSMADRTGLLASTRVFAGGADNACGAIGAGILDEGLTLCSIGTSGVILTYEGNVNRSYDGGLHLFNHGKQDAYYGMGVTLAAGHSLSWFKNTFAAAESYDELLEGLSEVEPGAGGLLFTPYLVGERTPHGDAVIRGSFIGMDSSHKRIHFARAVMEGITFSLNESIHVFRAAGKRIDKVVSIGGGARNPEWLQMQADVFGASVVSLKHEQGPGLGAAMLAAHGCGWFDSLEEGARQFVEYGSIYEPHHERAARYEELFRIYRDVYRQTRGLNEALAAYRL